MSERRRMDVWLYASGKQGLDAIHIQGSTTLYPRYQPTGCVGTHTAGLLFYLHTTCLASHCESMT